MSLENRFNHLKEILSSLDSAVVAFSGGVDSTFLLKTACDVLGPSKVIALTATSPTYPEYEFRQSERLAREFGVKQLVFESNELEIPGFSKNEPNRCYHCKQELFTLCTRKGDEMGISQVLDGSNLDDLGDYRPGREAARELNVRSPLIEAELTKEDIRLLSRQLGLSTWNKQPFACLSSRFPYGTEITAERLVQVDRCESLLREEGFSNYRVRYHGEVARIELGQEEISRLLDASLRTRITDGFRDAGFTYVALDLQGYRSGSMNETLPPQTKEEERP